MKEILLTSSVLILAVILLRLLFRGKVSQKLIYGVWLLVALRLLVPVQLGSFDFSILSHTEAVSEALSDVAEKPISGPSRDQVYQNILQDYVDRGESIFIPEVQEKLDADTESFPDILQSYPQEEILLPDVATRVENEVEASVTAPTVAQVLTAVWIAGIAIMAVWFAVVNLSFRRTLRRTARPISIPGCPIPVMAASGLPSPCLFGILRPTVYLTPGCSDNEARLRHVLTHELTHYAHLDHIWSTLRCLCLCIYWFDPLVWIAAHLSKRDCELACDEAAVHKLGEGERLAYGRTLVDMVAASASPAHLLDTATAMYESKHALKERVNRIVKQHKHLLISALCLILLLSIATGCVFTGPALTTDPPATTHPETTAPPETTSQPPQTTVPPTTDILLFQKLEAASKRISDNIVALGSKSEADFSDSNDYQRARSLLRNYMHSEVHVSGALMIVLKKLTDADVETFRQFILDEPYLAFCDLRYNSTLDPDPVYGDLPYKEVSEPSQGLSMQLSTDGSYYMVSGIGTCTDANIVIPSEHEGLPVRAIRYLAFDGQQGITSVTVPDSVLEIGNSAFLQCTGLQSISLPEGLRTIDKFAFEGCTALTSVTIPASVTAIGEYAFVQTSLTQVTIPDSITTLSSAAFYQCAKLTSVTLPDTLTEIGPSAFSECTSLAQITIPKSVTAIGRSAFSFCSNLKEVSIPKGVTAIGDYTFTGCSALASVTIPSTVRTIGERVFSNALTDIRFGGTVHQWGTVMKDGEWIDQPENHTVLCTDGNATHVPYNEALASYAEAAGLSYAEWLYRYCATLDTHLGIEHSLWQYAAIFQYTDESGALRIAHSCADGTYTDIPFDAAAGDLEDDDIWHWFFAEDPEAGYINGNANHLVNAFFADPLEFVTALTNEKSGKIDQVIIGISNALNRETADAATICESLLDTVTDRKVKDTVKRMLDVFD